MNLKDLFKPNLDDKMEKMCEQVMVVKSFLNKHNLGDIKFFIAGGSIFNITQGIEYKNVDVDIYFYNSDDFKKVNSALERYSDDNLHITENAITLTSNKYILMNLFDQVDKKIKEDLPEQTLQFIKKNFGQPLEIFETFDFNCSKCCITSDLEFIKAGDFSNEIKVHPDNISSDSLKRFEKYVASKNAKDPSNRTLFEILSHFLINKDDEFHLYYSEGECKMTGIEIVRNYLNSISYKHNGNAQDFIHKKLIKLYSDEDLIECFQKLYLHMMKIDNPCDELVLQFLLNRHETKTLSTFINNKIEVALSNIPKNKLHEVKCIYPEYFI